MRFLKIFIDRPVLSTVLSLVIVLLGIIGGFTLPVEQYPDIAPPTVMVVTAYPGANAQTIQKTVVAPLEEAINGVENMTYITSEATNTGTATLYIYFKQGTDPDMAAVNVQNRVSKATGLLPAEVNQIGVSTIKRQNSILEVISIYSPDGSYDDSFLSNYLRINVQPEILRIGGVGEVVVFGASYSMRIWLKPDIMAQYHLVPGDIIRVLGEQNTESATGSLGENANRTHQYTMKYKGRLEQPETFGEIVIRSEPYGEVLKLKDVADIELAKENYATVGETDGVPGITALIFQTAGSNATEVINNIDDLLDEMRKDLPPGVEIVKLMSSNDFLFASLTEVVKTLLIAIFLVVLVVYVFLQNLRATLIPAVSLVVSVIGTFAFMAAADFSINLLTLFALVLSIGIVVDNAIVVVEAVQTRFDAGLKTSYLASLEAMKGVTSPIVASTLVFMAVFIPVSFMGGTSGTFYTQFGITMAVAVGISAVNALTLCPALCAIFLKPHNTETGGTGNFEQRFQRVFNTVFGKTVNRYKSIVEFSLKRKWLTWTLIAGSVAGLYYLMSTTPTGLVPEEDLGTVFVNVATAPGTSLSRTDEVMTALETRLKQIPQIEHYSKVSGYSMVSGEGASFGMFIVKLKDWDERKGYENSVSAVQGIIYGSTADIRDAGVFVFAPPMIPGYGTGNGFELYLQDRSGGDLTAFFNVAQDYMAKLRERPEIATAFSSYSVNYPQYEVDVDAAKCKRAGISPGDVLQTLAGYCGGIYASNFNRFTKVYRVMIQALPEYRLDTESLNSIFVRIGNEMAPISQFITLEKVYGSETMNRFNLFTSIAVNGMAADGYSSGDAIDAIRETAREFLPKGYGYDFGGITREESKSSNYTLIIFAICILLVYLILSGLYESFLIPAAILLTVPFGLLGSFLFAGMMGIENNIYLQTGLIMLIGLLAKTAILITEYAVVCRRRGMSLSQSAIAAAKVRLRPILMTALCIIFGMLPMMFATGAGANGNSSLGAGAVGGMLVGTIALLFVVPVLFVIFERMQEKFNPVRIRSEVSEELIESEKIEIEKFRAERNKK
ncbi:MAG: efflux RND transporter permease subunit [Prevotellaceae bacterium]|jgi:HAE1 family hydrophobic/amphiphilic exporter-1|nr:efflux RND transporter permease subunit [Prevotellaceae bacterium]